MRAPTGDLASALSSAASLAPTSAKSAFLCFAGSLWRFRCSPTRPGSYSAPRAPETGPRMAFSISIRLDRMHLANRANCSNEYRVRSLSGSCPAESSTPSVCSTSSAFTPFRSPLRSPSRIDPRSLRRDGERKGAIHRLAPRSQRDQPGGWRPFSAPPPP